MYRLCCACTNCHILLCATSDMVNTMGKRELLMAKIRGNTPGNWLLENSGLPLPGQNSLPFDWKIRGNTPGNWLLENSGLPLPGQNSLPFDWKIRGNTPGNWLLENSGLPLPGQNSLPIDWKISAIIEGRQLTDPDPFFSLHCERSEGWGVEGCPFL
jgi:hypothetical protein